MASTSRWKGWIQLLLGLSITFLFFYMMAPFVVATLIGSIIALIVYPLQQKLTRKMNPGASALILSSGLSLVVLLPIFFILFAVVYKSLQLATRLQTALSHGWTLGNVLEWPWVASILNFLSGYFPVDPDWMHKQGLALLQGSSAKVYRALTNSLAHTPDLVVGGFVVILSLFFMLKDGKRFLKFLADLSPLPAIRSQELYQTFESTCRAVVVGMFAAAGVQGVLVTIFFALTGMPSPLLYGLLAIGMGMIPIVGNAPVWMGALIYLLVQGSYFKAALMLLGGVLIGFSDNLVRTWVMEGQSDMHPFLALVSVFGALNLIGAPGIFLGPVIAAVFVAFLKMLAQEIRTAPKSRKKPAPA
ncbi:MAG: AI-2E family transporter [Bdellovibrionales bacterium]|nr:AI-2E family transporter [Bdellovibrionales bacterium]